MTPFFVPFLLVAVVHLVQLKVGTERKSGFTKVLLVPTLLLGLVLTGRVSPLVTTGLALGWLGDAALIGSGKRWFIVSVNFRPPYGR